MLRRASPFLPIFIGMSIPIAIAVNDYGSAAAEWRVNMNVVDLELGRNFYVSPRLMLRPFYGSERSLEQTAYECFF